MRESNPRKVRTLGFAVGRAGIARESPRAVFAVSFLRHFLDKQKVAEENGRLRPREVYVGQDRSVQAKCR
jgi:hypothetical protein